MQVTTMRTTFERRLKRFYEGLRFVALITGIWCVSMFACWLTWQAITYFFFKGD